MMTRRSARIASTKPTITAELSIRDLDGMLDNGIHEPPGTDSDEDLSDTEFRPAKRRKTRPTPNKTLKSALQTTTKTACANTNHLQTSSAIIPVPSTPTFPSRTHPESYHHPPPLLTSPETQQSLLTWFTTTAINRRPMPWRKPFSPPCTLFRADLARRAYEVWISETMLQQTRVATVVGYYTRWMVKWPTIFDLAVATEEEVMAMWAGLGYYSRARRVWEVARMVCAGGQGGDGVLPGDVEGLMRLPGVGRYTAGAVAAIVFGIAAPVVDGNVLRVLSRQMGLLGDVKGDKAVVEMLWAAAAELVEAVAGDQVNEKPGLWGQALMELGSVVCTPKPNCAACPITETCRAYAEGLALAEGRGNGQVVGDIEDLCTLCRPFEEAEEDEDEVGNIGKKQTRKEGERSRFFAPPAKSTTSTPGPDARTLRIIINHARKFPFRKPKKSVREEETLVCAIRRSDGRYLIHQRPAKGLLAGLWELPSQKLPESNDCTANSRKTKALSFASGVMAARNMKRAVKHAGELGSVPWRFSHLKLTMHVHLFEVDDNGGLPAQGPQERWASVKDIDTESMGTGMKKCWALVKQEAG